MPAPENQPETGGGVGLAPAAPPLPPSPPATPARRASAAIGLVALVAGALFGGNFLGLRETFFGSETPEARPTALSRSAEQGGTTDRTVPPPPERAESVLRSLPWWQHLGTLEGTGPAAAPAFNIDQGAVQWRARWTCQTGQLEARAPDQRRPVVIDATCPGSGTAFGTQKGRVTLQVTATGPWRMEIEQQVDVPLNEPPLAAMSAPGATVLATGSLYRIDQVGTGTVTLYGLPDGRRALRMENFFVTANTDLELQFSPLRAPRSTAQVNEAGRSASVATLDVTTGSLNFIVPPTLDLSQARSLVVWCEIANSAYAAATLVPA